MGFGGGLAGDLVIGTSSTTFQAGDTVTVSIDDSDSVANCFDGVGFRDFVAFAGTPNATIPGPTATVQVNMGSTPLCANQEGGTKLDVMTINVLIGGPGPITVSNIRYTGGSNGTLAGSAGTGPVQLKVSGGGAVGPPFTLSTANTSNAWLTTISLSGGTVSAPITLPSPPVAIAPLVITEAVADAFGPAGTASDVCLDTSFNSNSTAPSIVWASVPTSATTGGIGGDGVSGVTIDTGPAGPSSRLKVSIQNAPTSVQTTLTLTGMKIQPGTTPGKAQIFLTDCDSPPFGTRSSGGNPASGTTFDTIGYFSNPSTNITPPIVVNPSSKTITRISGPDRIDTANAISQSSFAGVGTASAVVLARADTFPDTLAGTPLAAAKSAPLLLTGSSSLDPRTLAEIQRVLTPGKTVFLLGGNAALSAAVQNAITQAGYNIVRYDGVDRFDTATLIARDGLNNPATLLVADGLNFPDALAAGAAAAKSQGAVLLSAGTSPVAITSSYISSRPAGGTLFAIGGPAAQAYPAAGRDRRRRSLRHRRTGRGPVLPGSRHRRARIRHELPRTRSRRRPHRPLLGADAAHRPVDAVAADAGLPLGEGARHRGWLPLRWHGRGQRLGEARGPGGDRGPGDLTCGRRGDCSAGRRAGSLEPHVEEPPSLSGRPRSGVGARVRGLQ